MRRWKLPLDLLLVFLFTAALIRPLFSAKYLRTWSSIESTFIEDGRFLKAHWPHPQWQPLWYCGTRYDYIYPPVLRYGTALLARWWIPVKAYHVFVALFYCLITAGIYFLVRVMSRSRGAAWLAAIASTLVSPVFLLIPWRSMYGTPWRLWMLLQNGEGPHISSIAPLMFALGCAWLAFERRNLAFVAAAGIFAALVALTNFYGATALAILYPILVWSMWVTHRDHRIWPRAAAIPALAYGVAAFWLVPSYLRITLENLQYVTSRGNFRSVAIVATAAALFLLCSLRFASRKAHLAYTTFLCGSVLILGIYVWGNFHSIRVVGEAHRLSPELDIVMVMASVEVWRWLWRRPARWGRALAVAVLLFGAVLARHYVRHAWDIYPREPAYQQRVEFRMSDWIGTHLPHARTFVSGSVRFWWDTWHDLAQVGGGSEQGLMNPHVMPANWEVLIGPNPELAVLWLKALGADAVIVHGKQSEEVYHDFPNAAKFDGVLPVLYDDHQGNVIYGVPRRDASLARVVDRARLNSLPPLEQSNLERLRAYTAVIEGGTGEPSATSWEGTDRMQVRVHVAPGQSVLLQETYDPAWHAYLGRRALTVSRDPGADFSVIDAPPGDDDITFVFETPLENRIGRVVTCLSLAIVAVLFGLSPRRGGVRRGRAAAPR